MKASFAVMMALLVAVVGWLLLSLQSGDRAVGDGETASSSRIGHAVPLRDLDHLKRPSILFRTLAPPAAYGRVALLALGSDNDTRRITELSCGRVHYAGGRGLCAATETVGNAIVHAAYVFDRTPVRGPRIPLSGVPTRVRVAANGERAAITTYGEEETPQGERLAIHSIIVELPSGRLLADLREFRLDPGSDASIARLISVSPAGRKDDPHDFSSVAFDRDSDRFFATLTTSSGRFLVVGSVGARSLTVLRPDVANEAVSPNGRLLAIKRLDQGVWQVGVIDLHTWSERVLSHGRGVDDQVEWLDDQHLVYHDSDGESTSVWMLSVDGVSGPRVFVKDAYSASVQR